MYILYIYTQQHVIFLLNISSIIFILLCLDDYHVWCYYARGRNNNNKIFIILINNIYIYYCSTVSVNKYVNITTNNIYYTVYIIYSAIQPKNKTLSSFCIAFAFLAFRFQRAQIKERT